ncbi:hypothetical protein [Actinacidiphila yeochonensis]|uniref:hypothetical protein n=1 Tax=Actinacidiphila yeochonensis TaxID=89050 RepID=UPI00055A205B|nr:hypothetical protein [Actinacidiphila yeochonensis]
MRSRIAIATLGVAASTVLLVSGCGGSKSNDTIKQPTTSPPSSSASASTSPSATTAAAGRPTITFPSYAKNVFEDQHTGDPVKDEILADNAQWVDSMDDAIFQGTTKTKALSFYSTGKALTSAISYVKGYTKDGSKWAGTTRFFDRKVTLLGSDEASVIYCSDESKSWITTPGKPVDSSPADASSYVLYNMDLKKNAQGVWQTDNGTSVRGAKQCQP